jgi:hypothetical protein
MCFDSTLSSSPGPWQISQDSKPLGAVFASMCAVAASESWHELHAARQVRVGNVWSVGCVRSLGSVHVSLSTPWHFAQLSTPPGMDGN